MPGPPRISCAFFPHPGTLTRSFSFISAAVVFNFLGIIKVGYGVAPRPYPKFSMICCLCCFLFFFLNFWKVQNTVRKKSDEKININWCSRILNGLIKSV